MEEAPGSTQCNPNGESWAIQNSYRFCVRNEFSAVVGTSINMCFQKLKARRVSTMTTFNSIQRLSSRVHHSPIQITAHQTIVTLAVVLCLFSVSSFSANAAIIFTQSGEDLIVVLDEPIVFIATEVGATTPNLAYNVIFEDVFSTPVTATSGPFSTNPDLTMSILGGPSSINSSTFQNPAPFNERDSTDLSIGFLFAVATSITHNQTVTVAAGTLRNVGYFAFGRGNLPDQDPTDIFLVSTSNVSIGGAIPEPSSIALAAFTLMGLAHCRRNSPPPLGPLADRVQSVGCVQR